MTVKLTDKPIAIAADHRDVPSENRPPSPETLCIEEQRLALIRWLLERPTSKISRTEHPHQWAERHNQLSRCSLQRG